MFNLEKKWGESVVNMMVPDSDASGRMKNLRDAELAIIMLVTRTIKLIQLTCFIFLLQTLICTKFT